MKLNVKFEGIALARIRMDNMTTQVKQWLVESLKDAAMQIVIPAIRRNIQEQGSVFTGNWLNKQDAQVVIRHGRVDVLLGGVGVPYGMNLEVGSPPSERSPLKPNQAKVRRWVEQRLKITGRKSASVARSIATNIEKYGVRAHPAIMPAWEANSAAFVKEAMDQLAAKISRGG